MIVAAGGITGCKETIHRSDGNSATQQSGYDEHYVRALEAANAFCRAWQEGDYPTARAMLHPRTISRYPESHIEGALTEVGNPEHVAWELSDGRRTGDREFTFHVRLFLMYRGQHTDRLESPAGDLAIERDPSGLWKVSRFPTIR